jgi:hypothetical protein
VTLLLGLQPYHRVSSADTNLAVVKASSGQLGAIVVGNINASPRYLKFFDGKVNPTLGTDTPKWSVMIPGNTAGAGGAISLPLGITFNTGIAIAITANMADNDNTGIGAAEVLLSLTFM